MSTRPYSRHTLCTESTRAGVARPPVELLEALATMGQVTETAGWGVIPELPGFSRPGEHRYRIIRDTWPLGEEYSFTVYAGGRYRLVLDTPGREAPLPFTNDQGSLF